jgi:phage-related protein
MPSELKKIHLAYVSNSGHSLSEKEVCFHPKALSFIREQSSELKQKIGESIRDLQKGLQIGMPRSRPMPSVAPGVAELRIKDEAAAIRIFYLTRISNRIIVFHGFQKNTQKTPQHEIELGRRRLKEILNEQN